MSELVTGDAVRLGLQPARLPSRALGIFIDLALVWSGYVALSLVMLTGVSSLDTAALAAVQVALFLLVPVGTPIAVETLSGGRSVGKLVCGLRVVREDGGPIRFRHALVRGAIGVVEIPLSTGVIACVASLVSRRGRRLGDVFAGTLVVRERVPAAQTRLLPPPPAWAAGPYEGADLSSVPERLWLATRQYLLRAEELDAAVGDQMARRLASDLAAATGAPVPPEVPPRTYLAAMLAERQARDARRVAVEAPTVGPVPQTGRTEEEATGAGSARASGSEPPGGDAREEGAPESPPAGSRPDEEEPAEGPRSATGFVPPA